MRKKKILLYTPCNINLLNKQFAVPVSVPNAAKEAINQSISLDNVTCVAVRHVPYSADQILHAHASPAFNSGPSIRTRARTSSIGIQH